MSQYLFTVVIPAHNEEKYIGRCIKSIIYASRYVKNNTVEIIVVANRCTDKTAGIALQYGARVIVNNDKCISAIRNAGVNSAKGKIIVTIDADSIMTKYSLIEIQKLLESGKYIGGGSKMKFDRMSVGIVFSSMYVAANLIPLMVKRGGYVSGGMFWFYKDDFNKLGGFDESLVSLEDMDFALRLRKLGKAQNKKYGTLSRSYIITSSRKFDEFGDWYLIRNRKLTKAIFTGKDRAAADKFYYDVR